MSSYQSGSLTEEPVQDSPAPQAVDQSAAKKKFFTVLNILLFVAIGVTAVCLLPHSPLWPLPHAPTQFAGFLNLCISFSQIGYDTSFSNGTSIFAKGYSCTSVCLFF